jgi:hypothetical protein
MSAKVIVREFLETAPLLKKQSLKLPGYFSSLEPEVLELECTICGKSRPHRDERPRGSGAGQPTPGLSSGTYSFRYSCSECRKGSYLFVVEIDVKEGWIRKFGQLPPWNIRLGRQLRTHLGGAAEHFEKALICLSQSYGLAACAYLRRALEDSIDQLLRLEHEVLELEGSDGEASARFRQALASKDFQAKTEAAYRLAPRSIIVDGENPLKLIHDQLSKGVHRLSEDECTDVAQTVAVALEFTVTELNRRRSARSAFAETLRKVRERGTRSTPEA